MLQQLPLVPTDTQSKPVVVTRHWGPAGFKAVTNRNDDKWLYKGTDGNHVKHVIPSDAVWDSKLIPFQSDFPDETRNKNNSKLSHLPFDNKEVIKGPPAFRKQVFSIKHQTREPTEENLEKVVYPSAEGFHWRSNSPTYRRLLQTRNDLVRAINIEMMDRFGYNHSLHSMEGILNPETDSLNVSMHNICSYRGIRYPDTIFNKAVEERNSDWNFGPPVEALDAFKHPGVPTASQLAAISRNRTQPTLKRTVLKLPDIGVLISPVRVKFRGNLHYAYQLADEMRFGNGQYSIDQWIEELKSKNNPNRNREKMGTEMTFQESEADLEIPVTEMDFRGNSYMVNITAAMNRIESRLRTAVMEDSGLLDPSLKTGELSGQSQVSPKEVSHVRFSQPNKEKKQKKTKSHSSKATTSKSKSSGKKKRNDVRITSEKPSFSFVANEKIDDDDISGAVGAISSVSTPLLPD